MGKNEKDERFVIRVELGDQRIIDWYKSVPVRHKSEAVTRALLIGVPFVEEQLTLLNNAFCDLNDRLQEIEKWCQSNRANFVDQSAAVELVTQRLDQFDSVLAQAQDIIEANKLSAGASD